MLAPVRRSARLQQRQDKHKADAQLQLYVDTPWDPKQSRRPCKRPRLIKEEEQIIQSQLRKRRDRESSPVEQTPKWERKGYRENKESTTQNGIQRISSRKTPIKQPQLLPIPRAGGGLSQYDPVRHWVKRGRWPANLANMETAKSRGPQKRGRSRSLSSSSYTASVRSGEAPVAHSLASEPRLAAAGINLHSAEAAELLSAKSKAYCVTLLKTRCEETPSATFPLEKFPMILDRLSKRNEARIARDLTPLLVPSAESLFFSGEQHLEHVSEEVNTLWRYVESMGSSIPRPDVAVGVSLSAFSAQEVEKLDRYESIEYATRFTDNMYFPFLICEVKNSEQSLTRAGRQATHGASIATKAIWDLFSSSSPDRLHELNDNVLVFSVIHDDSIVKIFGHFPHLSEGNTTPAFYRYLISTTPLDHNGQEGRRTVYGFVRTVYDKFYSLHLRRIREALAQIELPLPPSDDKGAQQQDDAESSVFKKPSVSAAQMLQEQNQLVMEELKALRLQLKEQAEKAQAEQAAQAEKAEQEKAAQAERAKQEKAEALADQERIYQQQIALLTKLFRTERGVPE